MKQGFLKIAAVTPELKVADVEFNTAEIIRNAKQAAKGGARVIVFPELALTGATCADLFRQDALIDAVLTGLKKIADQTQKLDALIFVGLPVVCGGKLYNAAAAVNYGEVLGFVPKSYVDANGAELRIFTPGADAPDYIYWQGEAVPFGTDLLYVCGSMERLVIACEIGHDVAVPVPPSTDHAGAGAAVIVNCGGMPEQIGSGRLLKDCLCQHSARQHAAYVYAGSGAGESSTDTVYAGRRFLFEDGRMLSAGTPYENGIIYGDVDIDLIRNARRSDPNYANEGWEDYLEVPFFLKVRETKLERTFSRNPYLPEEPEAQALALDEALTIQIQALVKRMRHINCKNAVVGVSGGLDSTLALIVTAEAFDLLGIPRKQIEAVTMPCYGTTDRTYNNAVKMIKALGCHFREISVCDAVTGHLKDIGHDQSVHNAAYENAQARERTQVLMDLANDVNGLVVGTGDLSELALGWATYNGDHMSMYGVNAGVPKTMVRLLVRRYAEKHASRGLKACLLDVIDTPVSPELLPPDQTGDTSQKTEELVGPYELHDFVLYYMLKYGFGPKKILRMAQCAFAGIYDEATIRTWMKALYKRFFANQFKRSCLPDGPKVCAISLSPRGALAMPSDAPAAVWLKELEA